MLLPETAQLAAGMVQDSLSESGQIGRIEQLVLSYDGIKEGKDVYNLGSTTDLIRVHDVIDLNSVKKVVGIFYGQKTEITAEDFTIESAFTGFHGIMWNGAFVVTVVEGENSFDLPTGTYVTHVDEQTYVTRIETEIIHPMNDKYLPGVTKICPADYGIDLVTLINSGTKNAQIGGTDALWGEINGADDFCFVADTGTQLLTITPQLITRADEAIDSVGFAVQFATASALIVANVILHNGFGATNFYCAMNTYSLG